MQTPLNRMRKHNSDRGIIRLPKIAPHLRLNVAAIDPARAEKSLLVTSEYDRSYYRLYPIGEVAEMLLAAIDGRADATQLIRDLTAKTRRPQFEIAQLLQVFSRAGIVVSGQYQMADGQAALWLNRGYTPAFVETALARMRVALMDLSAAPAGARALRDGLRGVGVASVKISDGDGDGDSEDGGDGADDLTVAVVDDYLHDALAGLNRDYLQHNMRWLPVKLTGSVQWAGPVFNDGGDGNIDDGTGNHGNRRDPRPFMATDFCWHCLAERIRGNRQIEQAARRQAGIEAPPPPAPGDATMQVGAHHIALEIAQYLLAAVDDENAGMESNPRDNANTVADDSLNASLWTFDSIQNQTGRHRVNKNPACMVCGDASTHGFTPVKLNDPEPGLRYPAGGWRSVPPEVTWQNYRHLNDAYTGVVAHLEAVPNPGDDNCFIFESDNNIATQSDSLFVSLSSVQMRNAGKGVTPSLARAGALCEAIERYCASLHGDEVRKRARYIDFPDGDALLPNRFMNLSAKQFAARNQLNRDAFGNPFVNIPAPLHEDEACEWSPLWSVTHRAVKWTPTQSLYYGYPYAGHWIAIPDTNGVAAGNTRSEAFVHAFLEVLERDAVSLWWYNRLRCAGLDLDSAADEVPLLGRVVEQYRRRGRSCWALDLSFDLGVAVFAFMSRRAAGGGEICLGFGAHFDPEIALSRAICEHGQLWGMIESRRQVAGAGNGGAGAGDGNGETVAGDGNAGDNKTVAGDGDKTVAHATPAFRDLSPAFSAWLTRTSTADPAFQYLLPAGAKTWRDYPHRRRLDLPAQRRACLALVEAKRWELYLADFTRPSIGLPVLRVMIPQLRSMHRRLGPGRLYDIPVQLGKLNRARTEEEMNTIDIFI